MIRPGISTGERVALPGGIGIPAIGLGTWPLVGEAAADSVARGIANGYRHLDTAHKYGNEDAVGEGIRRSGIDRGSLWITSKLSLDGHSRAGAGRGHDRALEQLGVDYLDLLLIHWPNPQLNRFVEACRTLSELVEQGRLRAWGVSNFKAAHLETLAQAGLVPAVNQIQIDPLVQQRDLLEANAARGIATAAYSPLGRAGDFLNHPAITTAAARYGKTPAQVVLRWHLDAGRIIVPKSASDKRQRENLDVVDFTLTEDEAHAIDGLDTGAGPRLDSDVYGH